MLSEVHIVHYTDIKFQRRNTETHMLPSNDKIITIGKTGRTVYQNKYTSNEGCVAYLQSLWKYHFKSQISQISNKYVIMFTSNKYHLWFSFIQHANIIKHIGVWTKWPIFCRQHFQIHCTEWKCLYFDILFNVSLKCVTWGPIYNMSTLVHVMLVTCSESNGD